MDIMQALDNKDDRPLKDGWAPGNYTNTCSQCGVSFCGDKRAITCAPCAYGRKEIMSKRTGRPENPPQIHKNGRLKPPKEMGISEEFTMNDQSREPDFYGSWVKVEDGMPKNNKLVLVVNELGDITVGEFETKHDGGCWTIGNQCVSWDYDFNYNFLVAYWMPLPPQPKG